MYLTCLPRYMQVKLAEEENAEKADMATCTLETARQCLEEIISYDRHCGNTVALGKPLISRRR